MSATTGSEWSFTTSTKEASNQAPDEPYNPNPAAEATDVLTNQALSWRSGDADRDTLTYDVAFGTSYPPALVETGLATTTYDPGTLAENTTYYWSVTASDGISTTKGPPWRFTTIKPNYVYLPLVLQNAP